MANNQVFKTVLVVSVVLHYEIIIQLVQNIEIEIEVPDGNLELKTI